jgi:hypothetical protein
MNTSIEDLQHLQNNLTRRGFNSEIFNSDAELKSKIKSLVKDKTVGFGSSMTLQSLGIIELIRTGNRIAATCFGPGKVIYIVGANKITEDMESAMARAKNTAVALAKHFERKTPCVVTGKCEDCLSAECVCSITTIHRKKPYGADISVFLINGVYGL